MISGAVAMNPVDHPHGGGEGHAKGGRTTDHGLNGYCQKDFGY